MILIKNFASKKTLIPLFTKPYIPIWLILFFIGIGSLLGLYRSTNASDSIVNFIQYLFIFIVLLTVIEYLVDKKIINAIKVVGVFLIPHIIITLLVLMSYFNIYNGFDATIIAETGRYQGFIQQPTTFGNTTATAFTAVLFFIRVSKKISIKLFWLLIAIGFVYSVMLSGSFGAMVILFVAILAFMWFGSKYKKSMRFLAVLLVIIASYFYYQVEVEEDYTILTYTPEIIETRFINSGNEFGSVNLRSHLNQLGIEEFANNPLFGVGYSQFRYHNSYGLNVHNTIISAAVDMGIFGLIGVLLYVLLPISYSWRMTRSKLYTPDRKELVFVSFLLLYALVRFAMTFNQNEFISRDPWIPGLLIFVVYAIGKTRSKSLVMEKPNLLKL